MISIIDQRIVYSFNGSPDYAIPFRYDDKSWIWVFVLPSVIRKVEGTHYTLTPAGQDAGGTLTFLPPMPVVATNNIIIYRVTPPTQMNQLTSVSPFPARTIERQALDKLTMMVQDLQEEVSRCVKFPSTSLYSEASLPDPESGKALTWNSTFDLVNSSIGDLTTAAAPIVVVSITASQETANIPNSLGLGARLASAPATSWHTTVAVGAATATTIPVNFSTPAPPGGGILTAAVTL